MNDNNYIAHHGIKGQKWGVRRFQNPDGTRTALGKSRSMSMKDRIKARSEQKAEARAVKKAASAEERHEELRQRVIRHPKDLYKHKNEFSREEVEKIIKEIEFDRKIKDVKISEIKRGLESYGRLKESIKTTSELVASAKTVYNVAVETHNLLVDTGKLKGKRMAKIGDKPSESKEAKKPED